MKKIIFIFILILSIKNYSQVPAPPGLKLFSVIDTDNDGYTSFNIDYYLNSYLRNIAVIEHNYILDGYTIELFPTINDYNNNTNVIGSLYTNQVMYFQDCYLKFNYTGTGIQYNQADLAYYYGSMRLVCIDPNGDNDSDLVANTFEDFDGNKILFDNDTDSDGIFNFIDTDDDNDLVLTKNEDYNINGNPLDDDINLNSIPDFLDNLVSGTLTDSNFIINEIKVFPNPSPNFIKIENIDFNYIEILDSTGKFISKTKSSTVDLSNLMQGNYFLKINVGSQFIIKKIQKI